MGRFRSSSHTHNERWNGEHHFEHWYRDNTVYFITARCRDRFHAFASDQTKAIFWDRLTGVRYPRYDGKSPDSLRRSAPHPLSLDGSDPQSKIHQMLHWTHLSGFVGAAVWGSLLCGCLHWPGPTAPPRVLALFGGHDGYELISIPALAHVEIYRVDGKSSDRGSAQNQAFGGTAVVAGPAPIPSESLARVSAILRDDASYDWNASPDDAAFRPAMAIRMSGARRTLDLVFSASGDELRVYEGSKPIGSARLGPRWAELRSVLSSALPPDESPKK